MGTAILVSALTNVTKNQMPGKHMLTTNPLGYANGAINATLSGYHTAFWIAIAFSAVALVVAFFLKGSNHSTHVTENQPAADKGGAA